MSSKEELGMSLINVELIDETFEKIRPNIEQFTASFYYNLFAIRPEFKALFVKTNIAEQSKMLMGALVLAIKNIDKPQLISKTLQHLGARHIKYGASSEYYPYFGKALLITLEDYLGSDWTPEVKQAWENAYNSIVSLMLEGATATSKPKRIIFSRDFA